MIFLTISPIIGESIDINLKPKLDNWWEKLID